MTRSPRLVLAIVVGLASMVTLLLLSVRDVSPNVDAPPVQGRKGWAGGVDLEAHREFIENPHSRPTAVQAESPTSRRGGPEDTENSAWAVVVLAGLRRDITAKVDCHRFVDNGILEVWSKRVSSATRARLRIPGFGRVLITVQADQYLTQKSVVLEPQAGREHLIEFNFDELREIRFALFLPDPDARVGQLIQVFRNKLDGFYSREVVAGIMTDSGGGFSLGMVPGYAYEFTLACGNDTVILKDRRSGHRAIEIPDAAIELIPSVEVTCIGANKDGVGLMKFSVFDGDRGMASDGKAFVPWSHRNTSRTSVVAVSSDNNSWRGWLSGDQVVEHPTVRVKLQTTNRGKLAVTTVAPPGQRGLLKLRGPFSNDREPTGPWYSSLHDLMTSEIVDGEAVFENLWPGRYFLRWVTQDGHFISDIWSGEMEVGASVGIDIELPSLVKEKAVVASWDTWKKLLGLVKTRVNIDGQYCDLHEDGTLELEVVDGQLPATFRFMNPSCLRTTPWPIASLQRNHRNQLEIHLESSPVEKFDITAPLRGNNARIRFIDASGFSAISDVDGSLMLMGPRGMDIRGDVWEIQGRGIPKLYLGHVSGKFGIQREWSPSGRVVDLVVVGGERMICEVWIESSGMWHDVGRILVGTKEELWIPEGCSAIELRVLGETFGLQSLDRGAREVVFEL